MVALVVYAVRFRCDSWRTVFVYVGEICALVAFLVSLFIWSFGMAYQGTGLEDKLDLDRRDVSVEELEETALILVSMSTHWLTKSISAHRIFPSCPTPSPS